MKRMIRIAQGTALAGALVLSAACAGSLFDVDLFIVGEQTSLEKQVLGTYSSLGQNLLVYSSVRGVDEEGDINPPPPATDSQQAVFSAMRNREYNRDDVETILLAGDYGEANNGLLIERTDEPPTIEDLTADEVQTIIDEENADRQTILDRLLTTTPGVEDSESAEVAWIFATLNQELAPSGAWVQTRAGEWRRK